MTANKTPALLPFTIGGNALQYVLNRSKRAKHIRFSITADGGLTITTPWGIAQEYLNELILAKRPWLEEHLNLASAKQQDLISGRLITFCGREYKLAVNTVENNVIAVALGDNTISVDLPCKLSEQNKARALKGALETWFKAQARTIIPQRLARLNREFGFSYARISIRDQKTRWGSCSQLKNLNFNWRLVMAPLEVMDYVIVHELAHLQELNHSIRFWSLVESVCPNYKQYRYWLKEHGDTLSF